MYQKELLIHSISGKFVKNFDTFSNMDPFVRFTVGKTTGQTETSKKGGKQVQWKNQVKVKYYQENQLLIEAFDEDMTENESIGQATLNLNALKVGDGQQTVKVSLKREETGDIIFKYTLKELKQRKYITVSNIRCDLIKSNKYYLDEEMAIKIQLGEQSDVTSGSKAAEDRSFAWKQTLRLNFNDPSKLSIKFHNPKLKDKVLFQSDHTTNEFDSEKGSKQLFIYDDKNNLQGTLSFDYETINIQQKNSNSRASRQAFSVTLSGIKTTFNKDGYDAFLQIVYGNSLKTTEVLKKSKKDVVFKETVRLFAEKSNPNVKVFAKDKTLTSSDDIGSGSFSLEEGKTHYKVELMNAKGQKVGTFDTDASVSNTDVKSIAFSDISMEVTRDADSFAKMDPFVSFVAGDAIDRTETVDNAGKAATFKKSVKLYLDTDMTVRATVYDEDLTQNEVVADATLNLKDFKEQTGNGEAILTYEGKDVGRLRYSYKKSWAEKTMTSERKLPEEKVEPKKQIEEKKQEPKQEEKPKDVEKPKQQEKPIQQEKPKQEEKSKRQSIIKQEKPKQEQKPRDDSIDKKKSINQNNSVIRKEVEKQQSLDNLNDSLGSGKQSSVRNVSKKLPPVIEKKNYGDRIFDKQSATTLQKSILTYSMPKAIRFADNSKPVGSQPSYYIDSCFKADKTKGTSFGYGTRRPYPVWMERNMKENPAPGAYEAEAESPAKKGPTFGISYKYYEKVMIPREEKKNRVTKLSPIKNKP